MDEKKILLPESMSLISLSSVDAADDDDELAFWCLVSVLYLRNFDGFILSET